MKQQKSPFPLLGTRSTDAGGLVAQSEEERRRAFEFMYARTQHLYDDSQQQKNEATILKEELHRQSLRVKELEERMLGMADEVEQAKARRISASTVKPSSSKLTRRPGSGRKGSRHLTEFGRSLSGLQTNQKTWIRPKRLQAPHRVWKKPFRAPN